MTNFLTMYFPSILWPWSNTWELLTVKTQVNNLCPVPKTLYVLRSHNSFPLLSEAAAVVLWLAEVAEMVPGRVESGKEGLQLEGGISVCARASSLSQNCMLYANPPGTFFFFAGEWLNPRAFVCLQALHHWAKSPALHGIVWPITAEGGRAEWALAKTYILTSSFRRQLFHI